ncbi:DUF3429 domain-containing protein [Psychromonas sp. psych-6C06]|uniref:DUF3429 domain-containing protein n=1 Tax=Psychromonas sp. psych-6C06 TaxID=2058089 RepID=UPI00187C110D|nr:DUF3429 domain-containing protein [Psychromonas sp. psych-6C06]
MKATIKSWQWLGYLGLLPFVGCLWLFKLFEQNTISNMLFNPQQAFQFYSVIILTFLAGTLWRKDPNTTYSATQITSNLFCLYAYIWLFMPLYYSLIFLPVGYLSLLIAEYMLNKNREMLWFTPYFTMRLTLTFVVLILHAVAFLAWF